MTITNDLTYAIIIIFPIAIIGTYVFMKLFIKWYDRCYT